MDRDSQNPERAEQPLSSFSNDSAARSRPVHASRTLLESGRRLAGGRFEILRALGRGGIGDVYEAFDHERRGPVALKTLRRVDATAVYELKHEFRALSGVGHPNLVGLHELFADGAIWFFTMDLVHGQPFDRWVHAEDSRRRALEEQETRRIEPRKLEPALRAAGARRVDHDAAAEAPDPRADARLRQALSQLADAVSALHTAGKLHRDLKPSNVLVERDGRVVVLDFGLAADAAATEPGLDPDRVSGTPGYMAPEQAAGLPATTASDWYAVGVMLFEALTARLPFEGAIDDILGQKQIADAPDPRALSPHAPADLSALCASLLAREPAGRPAADQVWAVLGTHAQPTPPMLPLEPDTELVGREAELAALRDAYRASVTGQKPVIVMLGGDSGIGKSALAARFLRELRSTTPAALLLHGRCYERESVPFKAFDAIIDDLGTRLRRRSDADGPILPPRAAHALARLFPALEGVVPCDGAAPPAVADPHELRRRGFAALGELLTKLREREPVVVLIDDLQWTDPDSLALLSHLLRRADAPRLLFVGCQRRDGDAPLRNLREKLAQDIRVDHREIELSALGPADAALLAGRAVPRPLVREARGNPFLLRELSRHVREYGPDALGGRSLGEILLDRCSALPADARRLLEVIALSGHPIPLDVASAAAAVAPAALDALRLGHLVRRSGRRGALECYHDKIREALVAALPEARARELHRALANAWSGAAERDAERLALHHEEAGDHQRAAELSAEAAGCAADALGFERAVALYDKALALGRFDAARTRTLLVARADALAQAGRSHAAAQACVEAMRRSGPLEVSDLARRAGGFYLQCGRVEQAIPLVNRGLARGLRLPRTSAGAAAALVVERARLRVRGYRVRKGRRDPSLVEFIDAAEIVTYALPSQDPLRGALFATRTLRAALDSGDPARAARALAYGIYTETVLGFSSSRVRAMSARARAACEATGDPFARFLLHFSLGHVAVQRDPAATLEHTERAREILAAHPHPALAFLSPFLSWYRLNALWRRGELGAIARDVPALLDDAWGRDHWGVTPYLTGTPGAHARVAVEDLSALRDDLRRARAVSARPAFSWQEGLLAQGELVLQLYEGRGAPGLDIARALAARLRRSVVRAVPLARSLVENLNAWACLGRAHELPPGSERSRLLDEAAASIAFLRPLSDALSLWARLLEAGLAGARGDGDDAIALLRALADDAGAGERFPVYTVYARRRLGELLGGDEGAALIARADAFLTERGVVDPGRLMVAMAPGF